MQHYVFGYGYNLAGGVTRMTLPSGRVVTAGYDGAGRVSQVSSGTVAYASGLSYTPQGSLASMTLGNGVADDGALLELGDS